ncbi:hypothetical protein [Leptospira vanthielii]|uniref:Adenylate/guanylate cyclase catalytic domain protein n=1 Tax=Leptospira vanthielii serovar Holland str. Waz Holland = ATCC 700522 TaxID=1218591 RepID=N1W478_9LEPT|nr:hypothetical protein [Leptospira vanthielii]EMY69818.1 hypothetical protein LEP1GSC199_0587 [Leptospira vanthielii serovar Holland str. Waz Holland = ATCC 700522]
MIFKLTKKDQISIKHEGDIYSAYTNESIENFNPSVLGLGNIESNSEMHSSFCAIFDLEGFTNFSKQADPQLLLPVFFSEYLNWIFNSLKEEAFEKKFPKGISLYHEFPYFSKFMGDGLLFLWNTKDLDELGQTNLVISLWQICSDYESKFLNKIRKKVVDPPPKLRCGIAKGNLFSVGNGNDFVGPSINFASRLQKLPGLRFAVSAKGFNFEKYMEPGNYSKFQLVTTPVRGMSDSELILILKNEYAKLKESEKSIYTLIN